MSDQHVAEAATYTAHNKHKRLNIHSLSGIQTRDASNLEALDRIATGIGYRQIWL
jgi:hypothetical protein